MSLTRMTTLAFLLLEVSPLLVFDFLSDDFFFFFFFFLSFHMKFMKPVKGLFHKFHMT